MTRTARRSRILTLAIVTPLLALLCLTAWSFSSSVASSPDDDFHLAAIWCGLGERSGLCEDPGDPVQRLVPASIPGATCYAFEPDESGGCWAPDEPGLALVSRANIDGLYPPLFYAAMAPFATQDVATSVLTMRIVNSLFAVALLTGVFFALPRRLRPALLASVIVTCVPLGLFLYASTNPSSWAMLSAATVWVCLYGAFQTERSRSVALVALAILGAVIGAGARADAAAFAVFGAVIAMILGVARRPVRVVPLLGVALVVVIAIVFYLSAGQSGAAVTGLAGDTPPLTAAQHVSNLLGIPSLWVGVFGAWGLGWLDTVMPATVWVLAFSVFVAAIFVGIRDATWRRGAALVASAIALWSIPFVMLAQSEAVIGTQVQPRYLLPLLIMTAGIASAGLDAERAWNGPRFCTAAVALTVAMTVSLQINTRRYTTGLDSGSIDPGADAEWWWAGGPPPLLVWIVGSVAFAGMLAALWFASRVPPEVEVAPVAGDVAYAGSTTA